MMDAAITLSAQADLFVVIGTSLNVYPAAGLINFVPRGVPIIIIDPEPISTTANGGVTQIQKGASEGMKELVETLLPRLFHNN